jgi:chromosomal replication initiation ATPase DnaA
MELKRKSQRKTSGKRAGETEKMGTESNPYNGKKKENRNTSTQPPTPTNTNPRYEKSNYVAGMKIKGAFIALACNENPAGL